MSLTTADYVRGLMQSYEIRIDFHKEDLEDNEIHPVIKEKLAIESYVMQKFVKELREILQNVEDL